MAQVIKLTAQMRAEMRIPYALRRIPQDSFCTLLPSSWSAFRGAVGLAKVRKIGKNTNLELSNGRRCALHEGDLVAVVFGHRYATMQFEGYAKMLDGYCDLLSMGGLCGIVESKHDSVTHPTRLELLGYLGDRDRNVLTLSDYALSPSPSASDRRMRLLTVCGTAMDAGKTYTVSSSIVGLRRMGYRVAGIKLTGTAAGRDSWSMLDSGACVAIDLVDGGYPSTYLCTLNELRNLHQLLTGTASDHGADWAVIEIADGLLQRETAALLQSDWFRSSVDHFLFAAGEPMAAVAGINILRGWDIHPVAISGVVSMSPLNIREVRRATSIPCLTAAQLQNGDLKVPLGLEPKFPVENFTDRELETAKEA